MDDISNVVYTVCDFLGWGKSGDLLLHHIIPSKIVLYLEARFTEIVI